jgi:hypothetical protein
VPRFSSPLLISEPFCRLFSTIWPLWLRPLHRAGMARRVICLWAVANLFWDPSVIILNAKTGFTFYVAILLYKVLKSYTERHYRCLLYHWVNETLGTTAEVKITSQATNFIKQIFSFLAYGGSCIVKTLNQTSFHMRQMVRFDVEILASVGGWSSAQRLSPRFHWLCYQF